MIRSEKLYHRWPQRPLAEVAEFLDHQRKPVRASDRNPGPYPYYGANGQQGTIDGYLFDEPLVLLAEDGGYFGDPTRPIAYMISGKAWVNNHAHVLRARFGLVETDFLGRALSFYDVRPFITGTTRAKLTKGDASRIPIPIPPITEQRRIVEILGQADELRIKRGKADAKAAHILPALFYKRFGDPATNPKGWRTVRIRDLVTSIERRAPELHPDNTFAYIDIAGVDGERGVIVETKELLGAEAPSRARQIVHENDVIISTVRPYLKATALVPEHLDNQICSTGFCVLRSRERHGFGFLYALSRLQWFTDQLNARALGASYPAVIDGDILNLAIPYPDLPKAHEAFDAQILGVLRMQQRRTHSATALENLFAVLLHRAFTGDLTVKWREAHMKEILAEMETQAKALEVST